MYIHPVQYMHTVQVSRVHAKQLQSGGRNGFQRSSHIQFHIDLLDRAKFERGFFASSLAFLTGSNLNRESLFDFLAFSGLGPMRLLLGSALHDLAGPIMRLPGIV